MKKLPIILAATTLAASTFAYADVLKNDASPFAVNVPNVRSGFEINVEGLFLRPSNSDLDYGFITTANDPDPFEATASQSNMLTVKPDTDFAWGVGVGYVFPDSGNDVQLNWTEFNHSDTDTSNLANNSNAILTTLLGAELVVDPDSVSASSQAKFKLDVVDLDAGQYIDVGDRLQLRPYAGLRFAQVESNKSDNYSGDELPIKFLVANNHHIAEQDNGFFVNENDVLHSKFSGIGPLLGADANYNLGGGVNAAAHVATALLVGKVDTDFSSQNTFPDEQAPNTFSSQINSDDAWRVVPAFDAKLGLNYSYTFECDSVVTLEGGYKVTEYIDAVDSLDLRGGGIGILAAADIPEVPTGFFGGFTVPRNTSSLGFSGPYVKLSFKF